MPFHSRLAFRPLTAAAVLLAGAAYVVAFLALAGQQPVSVSWLAVLPAAMAGWTWGFNAGFLAGCVALPVNVGLLYLRGLPGWELAINAAGGVAHAVAPLVGAMCGRLYELGNQLQAERHSRRHFEVELRLTRRSLDATVRLLNDQATAAHQHLLDKARAEQSADKTRQELRQANVRLTRTSLTDVETALPNRRAAVERLAREWSLARVANRPLSCVLFRIDDLLRLRADAGPQAADEVLRETLDIVQDAVRQSDSLFSLGGEEFLIVCPGTDLTAATECAERLRGLIAVNTVSAGGGAQHVTVTAGVAANGPAIREAEELLHAAQQTLYRAQQLGRNRVVSYDELPSSEGYQELALAIG